MLANVSVAERLVWHSVNFATTLTIILFVWRASKRWDLHIIRRIEATDPRRVRRTVFVTGRGAECPECGEAFPLTFGVRYGWDEHILDEHPRSALAEDVRLAREYAARKSDS